MGVVRYWSPSLLDGSVTTAKLADDAVTVAKMAPDSVGQVELQTTAVTAPKISPGAVTQPALDTVVVSTSGVILAGNASNLVLLPYCFWPMIHVQNPETVYLSGHSTDAPGADNPRFALFNSEGVQNSYDVDYRYLNG